LNGKLLPVEINYRQNIFSVDFVALDFSNSSRMNYAYKLEGLNNDWIYTGNRSDVHFTNLKGGNYILRIKAANYEGQWFESKDRLILSILPPFWKSQYFIVSIIGIFAAISILYLRMKILEARRIQKLRLRIARDLHDEVGSSISGIQLTSKLMLQSNLDNQTREKFLERIQHASKSAMEMMSEIIWSLQPLNDTMEKMTDRMRLYASQFLEAAHINFKFEVIGQAAGKALPLDVRKDFILVYKEILNNIAKHSKAEYCSIVFLNTPQNIVLEINDDGIGFDPDVSKSGNGLKNIKSRLDELGAAFQLNTSIGQGTKIKIILLANEYG
jgi:signal transduction histidine kinase